MEDKATWHALICEEWHDSTDNTMCSLSLAKETCKKMNNGKVVGPIGSENLVFNRIQWHCVICITHKKVLCN